MQENMVGCSSNSARAEERVNEGRSSYNAVNMCGVSGNNVTAFYEEVKLVAAEERENEGGNNKYNNNINNRVILSDVIGNSDDVCRVSGNRWPKQETMALLKIRSDMDVAFRDSGIKAPLWEDVSRRMAALGYHRSAKKCKEKFENVSKYNKRLRNSSCSRTDGKTYRFSDQLDALDHPQILFQTSAPEQKGTATMNQAIAATPIASSPPYVPEMAMPVSVSFDSSPFTTSLSTIYSSGSESEGTGSKKRKWADFFHTLMKSVLEKQEDLQKKLLEAIDKCECERLEREEAWKRQEIDRIRRQKVLLMQERSLSAAKDAAVLAFLQKISEQGKLSETIGQMDENLGQVMSTLIQQQQQLQEQQQQQQQEHQSLVPKQTLIKKEKDNIESFCSRWPKEEVEALIRIKTEMEVECQRMGPLWEDISTAMKNIGYDRSAKRCKEKWENINKYYRRVKESNKQRPIDSKTCPYFHLLDSLYNTKTKRLDNSLENSGSNLRPEELLMHMMNQHSGQQQQQEEQGTFQQQGELIMSMEQNPNRNGNCNNQEQVGHVHSKAVEAHYQAVTKDSVPMNLIVSSHITCHE